MKKHLIMTTIVLAALTLTSCGNQAQEQTEAPKETPTEAPTADTTIREFNVVADYQGNPFTVFKGHGALLAVGDKAHHNAMTIGWGALGNLWGENINTITVYVAPARYTFEFMEQHPYFTVMTFDPKGFGELGHRRYENFPAGIHSMYIGRILGAWRR